MNAKTIQRLKVINQGALSSTPTLYNSYESARSVVRRRIPGVLVECGVYAGSQCGAMSLALEETEARRTIHCFDSFRGFPKASVNDSPEWQERLGVGNGSEPSKPLDPAWGFSTQQSVARVQHNLAAWGFPADWFVFHEGWFQDTVPGWQEPIALLRLDGDLYESTMVCLQHLYPFLQLGGICIMDDYALEGCRRAMDEYFPTGCPLNLTDLGGGPVWWMKE